MDKKIQKILISILMVCALIALLDIVSMSSGVFGSPQAYESGDYNPLWWPLFLKIAISIMVIFSFVYYYFFNKDLSEASSILIGSYIFWRAGASDLLYFIFQGRMVDSMPWLYNNFPIGSIAKFMGLSTVTPFSLILSVIIGGTITYLLVKLLRTKF